MPSLQLQRDIERQLLVFRAKQIDPGLWNAYKAFWTSELVNQVQRANLGLAGRYGSICQQELAARRSPAAPSADRQDPLDGTAMLGGAAAGPNASLSAGTSAVRAR